MLRKENQQIRMSPAMHGGRQNHGGRTSVARDHVQGKIQLHSFLSSAPDGGQGSSPCLTPITTYCQMNREAGQGTKQVRQSPGT